MRSLTLRKDADPDIPILNQTKPKTRNCNRRSGYHVLIAPTIRGHMRRERALKIVCVMR